MRRKRSILVVGTVAVLALVGSACGGSSTDSASDSGLSADAAAGKTYFESNCSGCHSVDGSSKSGPTLKGVAGSTVELQSGSSVTADNAYLIKSIRDPAADVVKGYPNVMGSAVKKGSISEEQARQIAAYIETLR